MPAFTKSTQGCILAQLKEVPAEKKGITKFLPPVTPIQTAKTVLHVEKHQLPDIPSQNIKLCGY